MIKQQLDRFNRLELLGSATALEKLERLSAWLGRDIYVKRDDTTPLAMGGNKLRKLEYLAADAIAQGADTLVTAGAIQSNHVRQTAALAAKDIPLFLAFWQVLPGPGRGAYWTQRL